MGARVASVVATFVAVLAALVGVGGRMEGVATAAADSGVRAVPVLSSYESGSRVVSRDVGISVALPDAHDLWLFGDTGIFQRSGSGPWRSMQFIDGSTALESTYTRGHVPRGHEIPSKGPTRFLPVPKNAYLPDGSRRPCTYETAAFPARWPTGAALMTGTSEVLVTYGEVCVVSPPGGVTTVRAEGWGYALYNWRTHHIDRGPVDVFQPHADGSALPPSQIFGWPQFDHGRLALFSSRCTSLYVACTKGQVWAVTMPATIAALDKHASYLRTALIADTAESWTPLSISVGRYPSGLRLIEMTSIAGGYRIFSAAAAREHWQLEAAGTLPGCPSRRGFCFALQGHPELSTDTDIFVSYMLPDAGLGRGHVVVSSVPARAAAR
jgi:hypothetical protein